MIDTADIRRRFGIKLLHLVEHAQQPLQELIDHVRVMRDPEWQEHFDRDGEQRAAHSAIDAFTQELQWAEGYAEFLTDDGAARPPVESDGDYWEPLF